MTDEQTKEQTMDTPTWNHKSSDGYWCDVHRTGLLSCVPQENSELRTTIEQLRESIRDIDAHATPIGLLNSNDPDGSPHHYIVTVGALHRALGKSGTAAKCEAEAEVEQLRESNAAKDREIERLTGARRFPVAGTRGLTVPWAIGEAAWLAYAKRYGTLQSVERIAERGGFGPDELDEFFPQWRSVDQQMSEIAALKQQLAESEGELQNEIAEHLEATEEINRLALELSEMVNEIEKARVEAAYLISKQAADNAEMGKALDDLKHAGGAMSNIAYNWKQSPGRTLNAEDCRLLDKLQQVWDAADRAIALREKQRNNSGMKR